MLACLPEMGCGRPIDLGFVKTVGQRGRHARIPKKPEQLSGLIKSASCKDGLIISSEGILQFANDREGITNAVRYIAGLKTARIIIEATSGLEMPLVTALQADRLPVAVVNLR